MSYSIGTNQQSYNTGDSDGNDENDLSREVDRKRNLKPHYKEGDALEVTMAWVAQWDQNAYQKEEAFWNVVVEKMKKKKVYISGVELVRSPWKRMKGE